MNPVKVLIDSFILMELAFLWAQVNGSDASCTQEQVQSCKNAAQGGSLGKLGAGGRCEKQQYVHYTHTCTLNVFVPDVDYCCCAYQRKVLCCRYNQNLHDMFRCQFDQDAIDTLSDGLPLKYLLPAILGPILLFGCCVFCCVKCCWRNEDCDEIRNCWRNKEKTKSHEIDDTPMNPMTGLAQSHSYPYISGQMAQGQPEREPLNIPSSHPYSRMIMPMEETKRPIEEILEADRLMPSAPDVDHVANDHPPYTRPMSPPSNSISSAGVHSDAPHSGDMSHRSSTSDNLPAHHVHSHHPHNPLPHAPPFMHHHSYPGSLISRQDSAMSNISAPAGATSASSGGGTHGTGGARGSQCPNCAAQPPTYSESLAHPIMQHQDSHLSHHSSSPNDSPDA